MTRFSPPEIWAISKVVAKFISKVNSNATYEAKYEQVLNQTYGARKRLEEWRRTGPSFSVEVSYSEMEQLELLLDAYLGPNIPPGSIAKSFKFIGLLDSDGSELFAVRQKLAQR